MEVVLFIPRTRQKSYGRTDRGRLHSPDSGGKLHQTRSSWQNRCVLRSCAGVDVMRHAFHLAQILRAQATRSHVSSPLSRN